MNWQSLSGGLTITNCQKNHKILPSISSRASLWRLACWARLRIFHVKIASEGRVVQLPYKGPVGPVVGDILGGLRSTCTYVGAKSLKELSKRTTFVQVNNGKQYNTVFENLTTGD